MTWCIWKDRYVVEFLLLRHLICPKPEACRSLVFWVFVGVIRADMLCNRQIHGPIPRELALIAVTERFAADVNDRNVPIAGVMASSVDTSPQASE